MTQKERVIVYIDGFNLYFGMTSVYTNIKWLNVELMAQHIIKPHQTLVAVKYFTSLVSNNPPKEKRQRAYLSALKQLIQTLFMAIINPNLCPALAVITHGTIMRRR